MKISDIITGTGIERTRQKRDFIENHYFKVSIYKMEGTDIVINQVQVRNKETNKFIDNIVLSDAYKIMPFIQVKFNEKEL